MESNIKTRSMMNTTIHQYSHVPYNVDSKDNQDLRSKAKDHIKQHYASVPKEQLEELIDLTVTTPDGLVNKSDMSQSAIEAIVAKVAFDHMKSTGIDLKSLARGSKSCDFKAFFDGYEIGLDPFKLPQFQTTNVLSKLISLKENKQQVQAILNNFRGKFDDIIEKLNDNYLPQINSRKKRIERFEEENGKLYAKNDELKVELKFGKEELAKVTQEIDKLETEEEYNDFILNSATEKLTETQQSLRQKIGHIKGAIQGNEFLIEENKKTIETDRAKLSGLESNLNSYFLKLEKLNRGEYDLDALTILKDDKFIKYKKFFPVGENELNILIKHAEIANLEKTIDNYIKKTFAQHTMDRKGGIQTTIGVLDFTSATMPDEYHTEESVDSIIAELRNRIDSNKDFKEGFESANLVVVWKESSGNFQAKNFINQETLLQRCKDQHAAEWESSSSYSMMIEKEEARLNKASKLKTSGFEEHDVENDENINGQNFNFETVSDFSQYSTGKTVNSTELKKINRALRLQNGKKTDFYPKTVITPYAKNLLEASSKQEFSKRESERNIITPFFGGNQDKSE